MKIGKFVDVNWSNLEITLKIMKKYLEIYWKPGKSWNLVSLEKWEPCIFQSGNFEQTGKIGEKITQNTEKFRELQTIVICYIFSDI